MSAEWRWVNLPGNFAEELVADLCTDVKSSDVWEDAGEAGCGRGCIVIQTNATSSFHVSFSHTDTVPFRGTDTPVLRFVVGKRRNSMTAVGLGNPYLRKEPIDFTKSQDALLTDREDRSRTYWFLYDRLVSVAAMGVGAPQADLCRLVCRFRDATGFREEVCQQLRYVSVSSGKKPVSLRIVRLGAPPDVSVQRYRFSPTSWEELPWIGNSVVFDLDDKHRQLVVRAQQLLQASPLAPFYGFVEPRCLCLNVYRLLDPLRRSELFLRGEDVDGIEWSIFHGELAQRIAPVLQSSTWTYVPMRYDRADCTSISLAPTGAGCSKTLSTWSAAIQEASRLRSSGMPKELLTLTFAFPVFPIEGENAVQARRDVVREICALFEKEWGVMEFREPFFVRWETCTRYVRYTPEDAT